MRVLVLGASGFVGSNVLKQISQDPSLIPIAGCRNRSRIPFDFKGEVREGDLCDPLYRQSVLQDIDVVCHAGTWSTISGNKKKEQKIFFEPMIQFIDEMVKQNIKKVILTSTHVVSSYSENGEEVTTELMDNCKFWPHLNYLIQVESYVESLKSDTQFISLRLGHFVGEGNTLGIVPMLKSRMKTHLVPLLGDGSARMTLVTPEDIAQAYYKAVVSSIDDSYLALNIAGRTKPTFKEVINYLAEHGNLPRPHFKASYGLGNIFAYIMEKISYLHPGSPFLSRSIVHLARDWNVSNIEAHEKIGYDPQGDWKQAIDNQLLWLEGKKELNIHAIEIKLQ